ncbi:hypothetical protein ACIQV0_01160 [Lysinibacillus capsici]|uniref:hypothetical protein n=1 Tax=Lysinibacillus capsici TaxID=2115968 RepID=UPI0037F99CCE
MLWNEIDKIINIEDMEWVSTLPNYQQETVKNLLYNQTPEEAAIVWLTSTTQNTSPFSAKKTDSSSYFTAIKNEFNKLLCGNPEYEEERKEINGILASENNKTLLVSSISALIGVKVGLVASFVAPVTVFILMTVSKMSINAWCEMQNNGDAST